jgi:hypothetical protein
VGAYEVIVFLIARCLPRVAYLLAEISDRSSEKYISILKAIFDSIEKFLMIYIFKNLILKL